MKDITRMLHELEKYDTPTVTNAVATYPEDENCLALYEPYEVNWYTDERIRALYPSLKPRAGIAVTCVYGMPGNGYKGHTFGDILEAIAQVKEPVILAMKCHMPEQYRRKSAMIGGNMMTAFKQMGVTGVVIDGPARDWDEMEPMQVQCLATGLTAGHGSMRIEAVNVPVSLCGMDVAPGEVIHMDASGSVKFPLHVLDQVLDRVKRIAKYDLERQEHMRKTKDYRKLTKIMSGIYR